MDDATGIVPAAMFCREEETPGYFLLMTRLIQQRRIPLALYSDRHPVFKFTGGTGRYPAGPTQFARAMEELGIRQIFARSPQAKGRAERTAGTSRDRPVTELRLAGAATTDEAGEVLNSFLPRFNEEFGVQAGQLATATYAAWGVSVVSVGPLSDSFGRRLIALAGLLLIAGSLLGSAFAPNIEVFLVLRVLTGLGAGMLPPNLSAR